MAPNANKSTARTSNTIITFTNLDIRYPSQATRCTIPFARQTPLVYSPVTMNSASDLPFAKSRLPIVLVGLMGVGKSTVGRRLAQRLALPFVDADHAIVEAAGMTIAEIFDRYGEDHFRDGERRVIARLMDGQPKVIATGGGAFINEQTRGLLLEKSIVIWLDADVETLLERVGRKNDRPLLRDGNPKEILMRLAQERNPVYAKAHVHVMSQTNPHDATVDSILKAIM